MCDTGLACLDNSARFADTDGYQISRLAHHESPDPREQFYLDMFIFSFLGCGMNLSDIARLRYSNIVDGEIWFIRKKTENEETVKLPITQKWLLISNHFCIVGARGFEPPTSCTPSNGECVHSVL